MRPPGPFAARKGASIPNGVDAPDRASWCLSDHIAPPEIEQIRADLEREACWADNLAEDAEDRRFRRKAWTVLACALAAFWIVIGAVVWMVWL